MRIIASHIVPNNNAKSRLSDYACGIFPTMISKKGIKKAIKKGEIRVDGNWVDTGHWVQVGELIELIDLERLPPPIFEWDIEVVYEDDFIAVMNKPAGFIVSGNQHHTIENALLHNIDPSTANDKLRSPRPVHRLDSPTSGLLLIAKTSLSEINLRQQFKDKTIRKCYRAIVMGKIGERGSIKTPIENKASHSDYELIRQEKSLRSEYLSLVNLFPKTGRTHQLRIHCASLGHPILGDKLYGTEGNVLKGKGLFLCAVSLDFMHPVTNEKMHIELEEPAKFNTLLDREKRRWELFN